MLEGGRPQQMVVLAALAEQAGRVVSMRGLVDRVWGQQPPPQAVRALQAHVARIRRTVEEAQQVEADCAQVVRRGGGYVLEIPACRVDVHRFEELVGLAVPDGRSAGDRLDSLRTALGLWRGEPLAGLPGPWAESTRRVWWRQRLDAMLAWARTELEVGNPAVVIRALTLEVAEHPLVEPLVAVLMQALAAAGRGAEALEQFATARQRLADELGADPGPELREVHRAILRGTLGAPAPPAGCADPTILPMPAAPTATTAPPVPANLTTRTVPLAPAAATVTPAQLPPDVYAFTGRGDELDALDGLRAAARTAPADAAAPVIAVVSGPAGVGKTALAIRWAHRIRDSFPDGQLYVNLRGYHPQRPMRSGDALTGLLAAIGVPAPEIPFGEAERAARYRTQLTGRRMLVVLDNAATAEQVRPLLPGTPSCTVLVTSRDSLPGLVALDGAHRVDLDLLPPADGYALLQRLLGSRVTAEPTAAAALSDLCVRLPLALRVAAELAAFRPTTSLADLVIELADRRQRLASLDAGGDPVAAVTTVFSWSLQHLPARTARTFRLLGLHPGPDIEPYAVAALADTSLVDAGRTLGALARAHLIHSTIAGRYSMHDLLRGYAAELAAAEDSEHDRRCAQQRLLDYYLATATAAMARLNPAEAHHRPEVAPAATPTPELADLESACRWLDAERPGLVAIAAHAASNGWPTYTMRLSETLLRYLRNGHHTDGLAIHTHAHRAATQTGDRVGLASALLALGTTHITVGRHRPGIEKVQQALTGFRQAGDRTGEARALTTLGKAEMRQGQYGPAAEHLRQALTLHLRNGDHTQRATTLNGLGVVEHLRGRYDPAAAYHRRALALYRQVADRLGEAAALDNLGMVEHLRGDHEAAVEHHRRTLSVFRELGNRSGEAHALDNLGIVYSHLGQARLAEAYFTQALTLFREMGERPGEAWALNGLAEVALAASNPAEAMTHYTVALSVATSVGVHDQQARAHTGLGHAHHKLDHPAHARRHYERALRIYTRLGSPEADQVRTYLAGLPLPAAR